MGGGAVERENEKRVRKEETKGILFIFFSPGVCMVYE